MGIKATIKGTVAKIQAAHKQRVKAAEVKARAKMKKARSQYERERIKAEWERENYALQRQMYEAKAAVVEEKRAVTDARHRAGVFTLREKTLHGGQRAARVGKSVAGSRVVRSTAGAGARLGKDLFKSLSKVVSDKPRRKSTRR